MGRFPYDGRRWQFENESLLVTMDDATFQKHLNAYLASKGIPTLTYQQLLAYVDQVLDQRIKAMRQLERAEYWLDIDDPNVRILQHGLSFSCEKHC